MFFSNTFCSFIHEVWFINMLVWCVSTIVLNVYWYKIKFSLRWMIAIGVSNKLFNFRVKSFRRRNCLAFFPSAVKSFRIVWLFSTTVKSLRMWRNSGSSVKLVRLISQVGNLVFPAFGRNLRNGSNWCFKQTFQFLRKKRHKEFWIFCETCPPDLPSWELLFCLLVKILGMIAIDVSKSFRWRNSVKLVRLIPPVGNLWCFQICFHTMNN